VSEEELFVAFTSLRTHYNRAHHKRLDQVLFTHSRTPFHLLPLLFLNIHSGLSHNAFTYAHIRPIFNRQQYGPRQVTQTDQGREEAGQQRNA
jgi:hypothetical protein